MMMMMMMMLMPITRLWNPHFPQFFQDLTSVWAHCWYGGKGTCELTILAPARVLEETPWTGWANTAILWLKNITNDRRLWLSITHQPPIMQLSYVSMVGSQKHAAMAMLLWWQEALRPVEHSQPAIPKSVFKRTIAEFAWQKRDMTPVNMTARWREREDWLLTSVVNHTVLTVRIVWLSTFHVAHSFC